MRLLIRLLGLAGLGGFIYFGSFDAVSSPYILYGFATLIGTSYAIERTTTKIGGSSSRPGWTLYRVNGKVRLRRRTDYARLVALEKELGIGQVEEVVVRRPTPPPMPSDSARSVRPLWAMTKKPEKYQCGFPKKNDYNRALFAKTIMDDLARSYVALHPAYIGEQSEAELRRKHVEALRHAGILGHEQAREMMGSNFTR